MVIGIVPEPSITRSLATLASFQVFEKENILDHMDSKIELLRKGLEKISHLEHVGQVRQYGFMVGIELVQNKATKVPYPLNQRMGVKVCQAAREQGLIIRPLGDVVVLMPPLCVSDDELNRIIEVTENAIEKTTSERL